MFLTAFNPNTPYHHLYSTDKNHIVMGCNEWQAKDVGLSNSTELIGKYVHDHYTKVESEIFIESNETILETGISQLFEEFCLLEDGSRMILSTYKYPLKDEKNKTYGVSGMSFPIECIRVNQVNLANNLPDDINSLTPTQLSCLYYLLNDLSKEKLANKLCLPKGIIKQHLAHILLKLKYKHLNGLFEQYVKRKDILEWLSIPHRIVNDFHHEESGLIPHAYDDCYIKLTKQQHHCFQLILTGYTAKKIASEMNLSYRTIQHYTATIYERVGLKNSRELISHYAYLIKG